MLLKKTNDIREETVLWLNQNQSNGFFEGFPEENMDFEELSDDELQWYYDSWVLPDLE